MLQIRVWGLYGNDVPASFPIYFVVAVFHPQAVHAFLETWSGKRANPLPHLFWKESRERLFVNDYTNYILVIPLFLFFVISIRYIYDTGTVRDARHILQRKNPLK